jgi:hypothetical protein
MKIVILLFLFFSQSIFSQSHKSLVCSSASSSANGLYVVGKIFVVPEPLVAKEQLSKANKSIAIYIYPNPVTSELTIESNEKIKSFSIYSADGKFVQQGTVTNNGVILSTLTKGYYTIIFDNDCSKTFKFLKN